MHRSSLYVASPTGVDVALPIAGLGSRSYAFLIDWHIRIILAIAWFITAGLLVVGSLAALRAGDVGRAAMATVTLPAAGIYLLYHPLLEVLMSGRTPGKRMAGVRLVTHSGGTPSTGALLVRNVFRLVDMLPGMYIVGLTACLITGQRVRLGDLAAGTLLVQDAASASAALAELERLSRDQQHDPALIDIANDVLRRWHELDAARRETLVRRVLSELGAAEPTAADTANGDALRQCLLRVLHGMPR